MKTLFRFAGILSAIVLSVAFFATPASAQATRTWVSGVGDDANPCSRTAPCKTFAGAISKTSAGGEIDCLDPGGFGAVTITKAITLDCGGGIGGQVGSVLVSGTNGIIVAAGAADHVKIRDLTINGISGSPSPAGLSGIRFNSGAALIIEHVGIFGMGGTSGANGGVDFEPNTAAKLLMVDVETQYGLGDGVLIKPQAGGSAMATLDGVSALSNAGVGVRVDDTNATTGAGSDVTVANSNMSGNAIGLEAIAPTGTKAVTVQVTSSVMSQNATYGLENGGSHATIVVGGSNVTGNGTGMLPGSGVIKTFGDNYFFNGATGTSNGTPTGSISKL